MLKDMSMNTLLQTVAKFGHDIVKSEQAQVEHSTANGWTKM